MREYGRFSLQTKEEKKGKEYVQEKHSACKIDTSIYVYIYTIPVLLS